MMSATTNTHLKVHRRPRLRVSECEPYIKLCADGCIGVWHSTSTCSGVGAASVVEAGGEEMESVVWKSNEETVIAGGRVRGEVYRRRHRRLGLAAAAFT